jgi:hypothetical protein
MQDAARLTASPDLFARKFDAGEDSAILGLLERRLGLAGPAPLAPLPEAVVP